MGHFLIHMEMLTREASKLEPWRQDVTFLDARLSPSQRPSPVVPMCNPAACK